MNDNNLVAEEMEKTFGIRTFSTNEMAFNLLGLMNPEISVLAQDEPIYADLAGGMDDVENLAATVSLVRDRLKQQSTIRKALGQEASYDEATLVQADAPFVRPFITPRANLTFAYPKLRSFEDICQSVNPAVRSLLDPASTVVVVGFGEVGPWGNSRTRWEMEAFGKFSLEGCIEMAWLMGFIKWNNYQWTDAATGEPIHDLDIKQRYESQILSHSGIRPIEPALFEGYDPKSKSICQEVILTEDMGPLEVSREEAEHFLHQHKNLVDVYPHESAGPERCWVRFKAGAVLYVPKALQFDRLVAGQIPTGWNAERYGIPKEIVDQVDPITLYVLVSTVEALVSAGITDPYELYQYVHVSEVGNTSGGGVGGQRANRRIFRNRFLDKPVQADILQESFINTMPAWVNLLLLSSAGPIKTPVGACATAVESVEIGVETILSGKAKVVLVGGYDDFQEEGSFEFASMQATSSAVEEAAKGREPDEQSRPTAASRAGFMESQGSGIAVLMAADVAIAMGCPIYGIVAHTSTATDKEGRSIPAPGQGILTTARKLSNAHPPAILDPEYRLRMLQEDQAHIKESAASSGDIDEKLLAKRLAASKRFWSMDFARQDEQVAPLEAGLATYGLGIDDIGVASFHGTGTKANDVNESAVVQSQMEHLGRTKGNLLPTIFQKYLTGHPKGAAAAWMMNG